MKGIELFYEEASKRGFAIGTTTTGSGSDSGNFTISSPQGKTSTQNFTRIAEIYGSLTFFHFSPEEAIGQIFDIIQLNFENL